MKSKELIRILKNDGWVEKEQKGSHLQLVHNVRREKLQFLFIAVI